MAVAAANLGDLDWAESLAARSGDLYSAAEQPEQAGPHPRLEDQIRAGVGHHDARHPAFSAQIRRPGPASRGPIDQAALLAVSATVKILEVMGALAAGRCAHTETTEDAGVV